MDTVFSETISTVILLECLPVCCANGQRVAEGVSSAELHLEQFQEQYLLSLCFLTILNREESRVHCLLQIRKEINL